MTFGSARVSGETTPTGEVDIDDFENRTIGLHPIAPNNDDANVEGAWGQASSGRTWRATSGNFNDLYGVANGVGRWQDSYPVSTGFHQRNELIDWDVDKFWYPAAISGEGSLYIRFRFSTVGAWYVAAFRHHQFKLTNNAATGSWDLRMTTTRAAAGDSPGFTGQINFFDFGGTSFEKTDWIEDTWYILEVRQSGSLAEARVYVDGGTVPEFQVSQPVTAFPWPHDTADGDSLTWEDTGDDTDKQCWAETDRIWFVPADAAEPATFLDDFERDVAVGLGINDEALRYVAFVNSLDGDPWLAQYVDGSTAVHPFTPTQTDSYAYLHAFITGLSPALARNSFIFATRFKQDGVTVPGGSDFLRFDWTGDGFVSNIHIGLDLASGVNPTAQAALTVRDGVIGGLAIDRTAAIPDVVAGEWYALTLDYLAGDHARLKFWRESLGEPDGWLVDITSPAVPDNTQCSLFEWFSSTNTGTPPGHPTFTRRYDYIQIV